MTATRAESSLLQSPATTQEHHPCHGTAPALSSLYAQRAALGWESTLEDLVTRVVQNTERYTVAPARLIGRRHVAEAAVDKSADPAAVTWDFSDADAG